MNDALFVEQGDSFLPTVHAKGYWTPGSLHGPSVPGLLAFALDRDVRPSGSIVARYSVEMFRMVPAQPIAVATRVLHSGKRLMLAEAEICIDGIPFARGIAQFVQPSQGPPGLIWQTPGWTAPHPDRLTGAVEFGLWTMVPIPPAFASVQRLMDEDTPARAGSPLGVLTPMAARQAWFQVNTAVVAGAPLTRFQAVAIAADFCNPMATADLAQMSFINLDLTAYLCREPEREWLGLELIQHRSQSGVAIGTCHLYDLAGPLGSVSVSALTQSRHYPDD